MLAANCFSSPNSPYMPTVKRAIALPFMDAGKPEHAKALYEYMLTKANDYCDVVQHGSFGAHMHVSLVGNGPFTIVLDSKELLGC